MYLVIELKKINNYTSLTATDFSKLPSAELNGSELALHLVNSTFHFSMASSIEWMLESILCEDGSGISLLITFNRLACIKAFSLGEISTSEKNHSIIE